MCLALPARVMALREGNLATVDVGGVRKEISLGLVEDVEVGAYVLVHVGYALCRIDEEDAQETLAMFAELAERFSKQDGA